MSRVYFTASMPHEKFGIGLPTLSFETNDHTGGGYDIGGLHPTSIATLFGKGPEVKKGERFDLKLNLNSKRTSVSVVVMTTKHLPHWEWSSDGGAGKLPLAALGTLATQFFKNGGQGTRGGKRAETREKGHQSIFAPKSAIYTSDGRIRQKPLLEEKRHASEKESGRKSRGAPSISSSESARHTSSREGSRQHKRGEPSSPARHGSKRSRNSSSPRSQRPRDNGARRAGPRKHDRDYDSGYASGDASVPDGSQPQKASSRRGGTGAKAANSRKGSS
ncbi:unnamed protein product [Discula destructiva]